MTSAPSQHSGRVRPDAAAVRALALSCHPVPSLAVTALAAGLAAWAGTTLTRGVLVTVCVLVGQLSIGWCNDALDAERDRAVHRTDKPVAAGVISVRATAVAAALALTCGVALAVPLGWRAVVAASTVVVCGWAYDLGLKATPWSWLPYAVAFATLPAIPTFARADPGWPPAWAMTAGALFGVAAHFANVLPDLLDDEETGVRGLPHRVGARISAVVVPLLLTAASVVILLGPSGRGVALRVLGLTATLAVALWAATAARRDPRSHRYFFAVIAIALLDVAFFALSGATMR
jgi:4-hydroxybenzoate polyprenyltransferase